MLAFLNTPTFPVFSPPTYFNPAFILRFYLSFIFYLAFIYCVLLFTNIIYHVMRTDTCKKPHTLRDAVTGRNRNRKNSMKAIPNSIPKNAIPTPIPIQMMAIQFQFRLDWVKPIPIQFRNWTWNLQENPIPELARKFNSGAELTPTLKTAAPSISIKSNSTNDIVHLMKLTFKPDCS